MVRSPRTKSKPDKWNASPSQSDARKDATPRCTAAPAREILVSIAARTLAGTVVVVAAPRTFMAAGRVNLMGDHTDYSKRAAVLISEPGSRRGDQGCARTDSVSGNRRAIRGTGRASARPVLRVQIGSSVCLGQTRRCYGVLGVASPETVHATAAGGSTAFNCLSKAASSSAVRTSRHRPLDAL